MPLFVSGKARGAFRGPRSGAPYFESWHYILAAREGGPSLLVAPGFIRGKEGDTAFIQIAQDEGATFFEFDAASFSAPRSAFSLRVDDSLFSAERICLSIEGEVVNVRGELSFSEPVPYLRSGWRDPMAGLGGMPARHEVLLLRAGVAGELEINGKRLDFNGGSLYLEKRRGLAFAKRWLWAQSSSLGSGASFALSALAEEGPGIPLARIAAVVHDGTAQHAMSRKAEIREFKANRDSITLILEDSRRVLSLEIQRAPALSLRAPEAGDPGRSIPVSMGASLSLIMEEVGGRKILEAKGARAAFSLNETIVDLLRAQAKGK